MIIRDKGHLRTKVNYLVSLQSVVSSTIEFTGVFFCIWIKERSSMTTDHSDPRHIQNRSGQNLRVSGQETLKKGQIVSYSGQETLKKGQIVSYSGQEALKIGQIVSYSGQETLNIGQKVS